mgnify:CR=1 FL=1
MPARSRRRDAGRLRANLRGKAADVDAAVADYNATLIGAVRDVADQVASLESLALQAREQRAALSAARSAYDLAMLRYRAGLGSYLTVLAAETGVLAQRRDGVDIGTRRAVAAIDLMRSDQRAVDVEKEGEVARRRQGGRDVAGITQGRWP